MVHLNQLLKVTEVFGICHHRLALSVKVWEASTPLNGEYDLSMKGWIPPETSNKATHTS